MSDFSLEPAERKLTARPLTQDFPVDAILEKTVWSESEQVILLDTQTSTLPPMSVATKASLRWSNHYVYVAFWCHYSVLNVFEDEDTHTERWGLWNRDVAEVFLNPFPETPHRYWEFEVSPNNQWIDLEIENRDRVLPNSTWNSGFTHATSLNERAGIWTCEMRIPVSSMGIQQIKAGMLWRVNFYRCEGKGDDSQRRFLAWSPTAQLNFHVPEKFGWVTMAD